MKRLLLVIIMVAGLGGPAHAANPDQAATDLSAEIMSPFCPGVTLHECPSAEALRLRDEIASWFAAGMTRAEILDRLENEYGGGIRAIPPTTGMGLTAWLVIALAAAGAVALATVLIRRWSGRKAASSDPSIPTARERTRLDDELARLRAQS